MLNTWQTQEKLKRRFTLPNELFSLGLNSAEISIYAYLLYCEDRKTHQCWPSYGTIAEALNLSPKTVRKYVIELVEKGLITTENTSVITKKGLKRNGNLRYTIRPIREAVEQYHRQQLRRLEEETEMARVKKRLEQLCHEEPKEKEDMIA